MRTTTTTLLTALLLTSLSAAQGGDQRTFGRGCPSGTTDANGWAPHPGLGQLSLFSWYRDPAGPVLAFLGTSNRTWGALPLPLDLGLIGLSTCTLYTDIAFTQAVVANDLGRAEARWPVPNDPSLAGGELFGQMIGVQDPRVDPTLALTTSSAVALRIGAVAPHDGFRLLGDPTARNGAPWTYRGIRQGVPYDLAGRLWRPTGSPPPRGFPAVVLSHGSGGSANGYSNGLAKLMVPWGMVCIAVNYTHADTRTYPLGSPGGFLEPGGHLANVRRALRCVEILHGLPEVDTDRIAAHGNSAGGLVTIALAAAAPGLIRVASHTAAGIDDARAPHYPSTATASTIIVPYLIQHGDADTSVPIQLDQDLADVLQANATAHSFIIWNGIGHELGNASSPHIGGVLGNVRAWFVQHGMFP